MMICRNSLSLKMCSIIFASTNRKCYWSKMLCVNNLEINKYKKNAYSRKKPLDASCVITQTGLSTWMFMYKIIFNNSARLVEITFPDAFFNLYVDDPDAEIWRTTTMRLPYFSYSYASEPSFETCTSIVADDSPVFIKSVKYQRSKNQLQDNFMSQAHC